MATTCSTEVGVFTTKAGADRAVADLKAAGYSDSEIGVISRDSSGNTVKRDGTGMTKGQESAIEGAAVGAGVGAAVGAGIGAGILAGVIPVIGPVLAIGTLGTVLLNAAGGAAATGLVGALVGWGMPEDDAKYYQDQLAAGNYLVTVKRKGTASADEYMARHGGYNRVRPARS